MNLNQYRNISDFFKNHTLALQALTLLNKALTLLGFLAYPCLLVLLAHARDERLAVFLIVPAIAFAAVSLFRKKLNRPRPYEKLPIEPVIKKDTKGHSFPSRHVFSMFVIAVLWVDFYRPVGTFLLVSGVFLAVVRVIGGVHFVKDVAAGAVIGALAGMLAVIIV